MAVNGSSRHIRRTLVCAIASIALLIAVALPAAAEGKIKRSMFGATTVVEPSAQELESMRDTRLGVYRLELDWRGIEREAPILGMHAYDWNLADARIRALSEAGLAPHIVFNGSPAWAGKSHHSSPWQTANGRRNWPKFVAAAVERYGSLGTFWRENGDLRKLPPVSYEIWNEQNSGFYYEPKADPSEYAKVFVSAAEQIEANDPKGVVVSGGMFATPQGPTSMYAWPFLKKFIREPNVKRHLDAVGVHPYSGALNGIKWQMVKFRNILNDAKLRKVPLQVTELGWSSANPANEVSLFYQGLKGQAKLVDKSLKMMLDNRRKWRLERIIWFTWRDISKKRSRETGCNFCQKMGLFNKRLSPKPAHRKLEARIKKAL